MFDNFLARLSITLQPYKDTVSFYATWLTIAQLLSPIFVLNDMRKTKSTMGMPIVMFLFMPVFSILNIRFALLLNDDTSFTANAVGLALSIVYFTTYYYFMSSSEKSSAMSKIIFSALFVSVVLIYSKLEDPEKIEHRFGLLLTGVFYFFFIFPILDTIRAFRERSSRHLPFPMILTGTLVGTSWLLHGIIINSGFIILQNVFMLFINLIQIWCLIVFPSDEISPPPRKKSTKND